MYSKNASVMSHNGVLEMVKNLRLGEEMSSTVKIDQPLSADSERVVRALLELYPVPNRGDMGRLNGKDPEMADEWRTKGNQELPESKEGALKMYSRSIALAPPASKELALGYLNRAAALFSLRRYDAALRDLGRAGAGGLPPESQYKLEEQRARCFNAVGYKEASKQAKKEAFRLLVQAGDSLPTAKVEATRNRLLQMGRMRRKAPVNDTRKPLPGVVGGPHPKVPCLSRHVDIRFSKDRGRHLVANTDIQPGDVLIVEEPLAAMLLDPFLVTHCSHCMKRCLDMVPCTFCSQVMFCSESCRCQAWSSYHKIDCVLLPHLVCRNDLNEATTLLTLSVRLMLKTFSAHGGLELVQDKQKLLEAERRKGPESKRIFDACGRYDPSSLRSVYYLPRVYIGSPDCTIAESLAIHAAHVLILLKDLTDLIPNSPNGETARFVGGLILRMITIRLNTNFGLGENDLQIRRRIGNAVYAVSSLINHSCNPNAFQMTANGAYGILIACQPIEKGEEITVCYGSTYAELPLCGRKLQLASYQFECRCRACLDDWPLWQEPTLKRDDYTLKCNHCGGKFQGPIHRSSVMCTHCSHRVSTNVLGYYNRIHNEREKAEGNWRVRVEPIRELHKVMAYPNDFLLITSETMRLAFARSGNDSKDSW